MNPIIMSATMDYTQPIEGVMDKLAFGGMMILIGMAAVFAVLFTIYLSLVIFKFAFSSNGNKKSTKNEDVPVVMQPVNEASDDIVIAVIAAAIAAAEEENPGKQFRVVSFRRV